MATGFYHDKGSIYAHFRKQIDGSKISLKYYLGISVDKDDWLPAKQKAKDETVNKLIIEVHQAINSIIDEHNPFSLTNETFTILINKKLKNKKGVVQTSFFDYADEFFSCKRDEVGFNRAKNIQTTIRKLREFKPTLTFEEINDRFYREFLKFLHKKGYAANYVSKHITNIKRILNQATKDKINTSLDYREFEKTNEEVFNIYLTEQEIERINNLILSKNTLLNDFNRIEKEAEINGKPFTRKFPNDFRVTEMIKALDRSRRLFVIGCWTGLRVENYLGIDPDIQISDDGKFIHAIANKNGPKLKIPLHKLVRDIIAEGFPESISEQKLNKHIKELGRLAGINETVIYSRTEGGKRKEYSNHKYELITSHTARRSFASNLLSRGIPKQYIMAVTGHKTESSFNKYTQAIQKDLMTAKMAEYDVWD